MAKKENSSVEEYPLESEVAEPAVAEPGVLEPIVAAEPVAVTPLHNVVSAVEVLINVVRQLSATWPGLAGLAGYANQVEYWIKEARSGLDPQPTEQPKPPVDQLPPL